MEIAQIMTKSPTCCSPSCTAEMAARLMQQSDTGFLPVIDNVFSRKLAGVVTDRDLCMAVVATGRDAMHVMVHECMNPKPFCCDPDEEVHRALQVMKDCKVRRLPVTDVDNRILGVITIGDLIRRTSIEPGKIYEVLDAILEPVDAEVEAVPELVGDQA